MHLLVILASFWLILGSSWGPLAHLGDPWRHLWRHLVPSWLILGSCWPILAHLGMIISISQCKYAFVFSEKLIKTWFSMVLLGPGNEKQQKNMVFSRKWPKKTPQKERGAISHGLARRPSGLGIHLPTRLSQDDAR